MNRLLLLLALGLLIPATSSAIPLTYTASLSGPNEYPGNVSSGIGSTTVIHDADLHTLQISVSFSGLSGTTTAAHIHCCVSQTSPAPVAGVAVTPGTLPGFPSGVTAGTYAFTLDLTDSSNFTASFLTANGGTAASAEAALAAGLASRFAYLNIHSTLFTGGEIRGFLVPEPMSSALLAVAFCALALRGRSRRS